LAALVATAALALAGCSGDEDPVPEPTPTLDARLLESAREGGASAEQLGVLQTGQVTFEQYQAAVNQTVDCMRDAGIDVIGDDVTQTRGFPEISYSFANSSAGRTAEQTLAIADECIATHSMYIEQAYQLAPGSLEQQEAAFDPYRESMVQCVRDNGGDVADDATAADVLIAAAALEVETGVSCTSQSGYDG
jgi:hypothetical protein